MAEYDLTEDVYTFLAVLAVIIFFSAYVVVKEWRSQRFLNREIKQFMKNDRNSQKKEMK